MREEIETGVEDANAAAPETAAETPAIQALSEVLPLLRTEQNLVMGALAGSVAALVGAAIWAVVTVASERQIGYMALGVGVLVGFAVRIFGKGIDPVFGYLGGALAFVGCLAGNVLSGCGFIANSRGMPILDVVSQLNFEVAWAVLSAMSSPMDLLFYGLAIYEGNRFAIRQVTAEEIEAVRQGAAL